MAVDQRDIRFGIGLDAGIETVLVVKEVDRNGCLAAFCGKAQVIDATQIATGGYGRKIRTRDADAL